jgi:hypothetical protein
LCVGTETKCEMCSLIERNQVSESLRLKNWRLDESLSGSRYD